MFNQLEAELKMIVEACQQIQLPIFVIGAFSVRAYDCLLRPSYDLDFVVSRSDWPRLKQVLTEQGYALSSKAAWVAATKGEEEETIEVHIALDGITDFNSASI